MSRGPRGAIPSPAPSRRKPAKRGCMALATSCSLVGRSSHASLVRDHVERLECGAGLDGLDAAERVAQQLFEMFRLHLAACPEHHFPEFEVATEWPEVNLVGLAGLVEVDYAPVLRFVSPVLELGSE